MHTASQSPSTETTPAESFPFDWQSGYPSQRMPVFAKNIVATSQPLAAQAGLRMLARGGNAIDAAIAAAAAITIVEPVSCGLGSDAFAIVWDGHRLQGLNASGYAPASWDRHYFERKHGGQIPMRGWDSVTVPGVIAGWMALHERYGSLPLADLLEPAIELAEAGHGVATIVQRKWASQVDGLKAQPGFAEAFMPFGRAPRVGERFRLPAAAKTLQRIAESKGRDFYEGQTAEAMVEHAMAHGGSLRLDDLRDYRVDWVDTISQAWGAYQLHEIPPNGQGIAALMALGMLRHIDFEGLDPDGLDARHLQIEAMKAAFEDVYRWVADPQAMNQVRAQDLLSDTYLASRAALIKRDRATAFEHGLPPGGGTIYLSAADAQGRMISFIQSNYMGFGSGVVVPEIGVSLQNRGYGFSMQSDHPNLVKPRHRPFQTIIPGFLMRGQQPQMSFGVMGGNMQPQGHLQTLLRMIHFKQNPQAACDAPRWKVSRGLSVDVEATMDASVVQGLRDRGHVLEPIADPYMDFGSGQFIWRMSDDLADGYVAASDSRRDGYAAGF
nr:gamma-glutamyltransferase family protein [Betaproteobacteria bacterium]